MKTVAALVFIGLSCAACGKKGPPLPPLVRLPAAPADLAATRRASTVSLQFVIPRANADGSTPADLDHVDVYALDAVDPPLVSEIVKRGDRVARIKVNPPPDPDEVGDEQTLADPREAKENDQGAIARMSETLSSEVLSLDTGTRSYVAVGFSKRGRSGMFTPPVAVPLGVSPEPPAAPRVTYDDAAIRIVWSSSEPVHLYLQGESETRLSEAPLTEPRFEDAHVTWGEERCYAVRAVTVRDGLPVESDPSPPACVTPADTFAPKAPVGLQAIASEGAVNLIWEASPENDLAGYFVVRAIAPSTELTRVTTEPIPTPTFTDSVPSGSQVTYAVEAVDKAGNVSAASARVAETAR